MARFALATLACLAVAAIAAAETHDIVDLEIAELEQKLIDARARKARGEPGTVSRKRMAELDIFDLSNQVTGLMDRVSSTQKQQAKLPETIGALSAAVNMVVPSIKRIDALIKSVNAIEPKLAAVTEAVEGIDGKIEKKFGPLDEQIKKDLKAITDALGTTETKLTEQMDAVVESVPKKLDDAAKASKKVTDALATEVAKAVTAANAAGIDAIFTQWGRKTCTAPSGKTIKKLFDGWLFGSRHNYAGGGAKSICMKNQGGSHGGNPTGGDSADMIYPIRTDHCGYTGGTIWDRNCGDFVPCSRCFVKGKTCYVESGVAGCTAPDYEAYYSGMMWGGHEGHHGNVNRFCMDQGGSNSDWDVHDNYNGYVYPTIHRGNIANRNGQFTLKCFLCCQK